MISNLLFHFFEFARFLSNCKLSTWPLGDEHTYLLVYVFFYL